jgi:hypothetical protein
MPDPENTKIRFFRGQKPPNYKNGRQRRPAHILDKVQFWKKDQRSAPEKLGQKPRFEGRNTSPLMPTLKMIKRKIFRKTKDH